MTDVIVLVTSVGTVATVSGGRTRGNCDGTDDKGRNDMWLNERRARSVKATRYFYETIRTLFPDGVEMTQARWNQIEKHVTDNSLALSWDAVAAAVLTDEGNVQYAEALGAHQREHAVAAEIAADQRRARHYREMAAWRKKFQVAPHDNPTGEAATDLERIRQLNTEQGNRAARAQRRFALRTLVALATEHAKPSLREQPRALTLGPGEVLVTSTTLEKLGSCGTYVSRFEERWPDGTVITKELCVDNADDFEWSWAAQQLLDNNNTSQFREWERRYIREQDRIQRVIGELNSTHRTRLRAVDAQRERGEINGTEHRRKQAELRDEVTRLVRGYEDAYRKAQAAVFAELYALHPRPNLAEYAA